MIFQNPRAALNPIRPSASRSPTCCCAMAAVTRATRAAACHRDAARGRASPIPSAAPRAYPFELSGGMCQRVMIAIALACQPALLIADEPTTGLDVTTQAVVMDLIAELAPRRGMATILITHDLGAGRRALRPHRGHACRPYRRGGADRGAVRRAAPSLHAPAAGGDADARPATWPICARSPAACPTCAATTCRPAASPPAARSAWPPARRRWSGATWRPPTASPAGIRMSGHERHPRPSPTRGGRPDLLDVAELLEALPARPQALFGGAAQSMVHAVDDVSFTLARGETLGLVGESGCGKSTLVRLITRLTDPTTGSIRFGTRELAALPAQGLRPRPGPRADPDRLPGCRREHQPALHRGGCHRRPAAADDGPVGRGAAREGRGSRDALRPAAGAARPLPAPALGRAAGPRRHRRAPSARGRTCWCSTSRPPRSTSRCR